ncbi:carboxypeptidase-like regulatory domain-containing protein [Mucilaginibacter gossypii]|uniref:CarboxypepD_reg-like domain-containing protein n=1 Tax=Mucilaginibacter gossypii TaxID=551996 RepID=A0A1G7MRF0_9SPHI|nr:carboxypeptidase-like regulatory domain-containing protein [Mucilaginibacter gossypii]SDF64332.1 CarboxypepD_reg-like domain-containing protein [Mucilaginibacter gossypii]
MKKILLFTLVLLTITPLLTLAQKKAITGIVTDAASNAPMPGVSVHIKGSNLGTSTNAKGIYTISAAATDELIISYTGYKP